MTLDINNDSHNSMVCSGLTFHPPPGICFLSWEGQDPRLPPFLLLLRTLFSLGPLVGTLLR